MRDEKYRRGPSSARVIWQALSQTPCLPAMSGHTTPYTCACMLWHAGHMSGNGSLSFPDGLSYEGRFVESRMEGHGVFVWPGGERYEGGVLAGLRHGHGGYSANDGTVFVRAHA